jgi:hypothetical protein
VLDGQLQQKETYLDHRTNVVPYDRLINNLRVTEQLYSKAYLHSEHPHISISSAEEQGHRIDFGSLNVIIIENIKKPFCGEFDQWPQKN